MKFKMAAMAGINLTLENLNFVEDLPMIILG
jgi:hypothetical protein